MAFHHGMPPYPISTIFERDEWRAINEAKRHLAIFEHYLDELSVSALIEQEMYIDIDASEYASFEEYSADKRNEFREFQTFLRYLRILAHRKYKEHMLLEIRMENIQYTATIGIFLLLLMDCLMR
jgi:hypothetical protein